MTPILEHLADEHLDQPETAPAEGPTHVSWTESNQSLLQVEFARIHLALTDTVAAHPDASGPVFNQAPAAIDQLTAIFDLSSFERDVLLLTAGVEMDASLAELAAKQGPITFSLALNRLSNPHWSALTPTRPLRHMRLIDLDVTRSLTSSPLRIDERILHYIAGTNLLDARLNPFVKADDEPIQLAPSQRATAARIVHTLLTTPGRLPVLHLCGDDPEGQQDVAAVLAAELDRRPLVLHSESLPPTLTELDQILLLIEREMHLLPAVVLLRCSPGPLSASARRMAERLPAPFLIASRDSIRLEVPLLRFDIDKPAPPEQRSLWQAALSPTAAALAATLDEIATQFSLSAAAIHTVARQTQQSDPGGPTSSLWGACRAVSRPQLDSVAQRLETRATWDDLILPETLSHTLRQLVQQVRHRMKVHQVWGFASGGTRGLGVSALFSGESGTGKTLAAEVLANELRLDLYRIDLSSVVSKYIGETEKNLRVVFDAAETGGVLLLFDEADALFGKRAEVKDSHDRYANIEVGYLLQRMEAYQGLAILTTNLKSSLDRSFQRRLRFILNFPFPGAAQREGIWRRVFPLATPLENLDYARLAQLNIAGGNIRNIALNAAFLAAAQGSSVGMPQLLEAAQLEAEKIERALSPAETRGWQ